MSTSRRQPVPGRASSSFQAPVTSSIEIEQYYHRHFWDTLTAERVAAAGGPG